jgi:hypothetical protein
MGSTFTNQFLSNSNIIVPVVVTLLVIFITAYIYNNQVKREGFAPLVNQPAIDEANELGGIAAVKAKYNQIYLDSTSSDPKKQEAALMQGYGIYPSSSPFMMASAPTNIKPDDKAVAKKVEEAKKATDDAKKAQDKAAIAGAQAANSCGGGAGGAGGVGGVGGAGGAVTAADQQKAKEDKKAADAAASEAASATALANAKIAEAKKATDTLLIESIVSKVCGAATVSAVPAPKGLLSGAPAPGASAGLQAVANAISNSLGAAPAGAKACVVPPAPALLPPSPANPAAPPPPAPAPQAPPASIVAKVSQHCKIDPSFPGWQREVGGAGKYTAPLNFPVDASFISVPAGLTAKLTKGGGGEKIVVGPSDFDFCSMPGFNDNVKSIEITVTGQVPPAVPTPAAPSLPTLPKIPAPMAVPPAVSQPPKVATVAATPPPKAPAPPPYKGQTISILTASYGKNCNGALEGNRTDLFKQLANGKPSLDYTYNYTKTGGDPAGGCGKTLNISYKCGEDLKTYTAGAEAGFDAKVLLDCTNSDGKNNAPPPAPKAQGENPKCVQNVKYIQLGFGPDYINLSQLVGIDSMGKNVTKGRPASGPVGWGGEARNAVDGGESARPYPNEYHSAAPGQVYEVTLDGPTKISSLVVYNRTDCCTGRMAGHVIKLLDVGKTVLWTSPKLIDAPSQTVVVNESCTAPVKAVPSPPLGPMVKVSEHCGPNGGGWQKNVGGPGKYTSPANFPRDASFISVPMGLTAKLTSGGGEKVVVGPGSFDFCSAGGFNDGVTAIEVTVSGQAPPKAAAPQVTQKVKVSEHCGPNGGGWQKDVGGPGKYTSPANFPRDASFISVPMGLTAKVTNGSGGKKVVIGPGSFDFCSVGGFNDGVTEIEVSLTG